MYWPPSLQLTPGWHRLILVYPVVSSAVFQSFYCQDIINESFLVADYRETCPNDDHSGKIFVWSVICIFLYPIGIPALFVRLLYYFDVPKLAQKKTERALVHSLLDLYMRNIAVSWEIIKKMGGKKQLATDADKQNFRNTAQKVFNQIDANGNGRIERDEMYEYMVNSGIVGDQTEVNEMWMSYDSNNDGRLEFDEFYQMLLDTNRAKEFTGHETLADLNDTQLRNLCTHPWPRMTDEDRLNDPVVQAARQADPNSDLSFKDRVSMKRWITKLGYKLMRQSVIPQPAVSWNGATKKEQQAMERIGMLFRTYQVSDLPLARSVKAVP
eukprot:1161836-Rhodomonas_salina.2